MSCTSQNCIQSLPLSEKTSTKDTLTTTVVRYHPVKLPYYRTIVKDYGPEPGVFPASVVNYTHYDLYCLRTLLVPYLHQHHRNTDVRFINYKIHDEMRVTLELYNGDEFVVLTKDQALALEAQCAYLIEEFGGVTLLYSDRIPLEGIPVDWMSSILQFIKVEESYYQEGCIYIVLDSNTNYSDHWETLHQQLIDLIKQSYDNGVVPLIPNVHQHIISHWGLVPNMETYDPEELDMVQLYAPNWADDRFAADRVQFINNIVAGKKYIHISMGSSEGRNVKRHYVAVALGSTYPDYYFSRCCVHVSVDNITDAMNTCDLVTRALNSAMVIGGSTVLGTATAADKVPTDDAVTYRVLDTQSLEYVLSRLEINV